MPCSWPHTLLAGKPDGGAARLKTANLGAYLAWLMRWGWLDSALGVEAEMVRRRVPTSVLRAELVEQLLARKRVPEAIALGKARPGQVTNAGFETEITHTGFDWSFASRVSGVWRIRQVSDTVWEGLHCIMVSFNGEENSSFSHLRQIVPVRPGESYVLTAWWKGERITTDQGPFLEVDGYDAKGLHVKSPMLLGTSNWEKVSLGFSVPDGCHAVYIRLRRMLSRKLNNKIKGTLWLDAFRLEEETDQLLH